MLTARELLTIIHLSFSDVTDAPTYSALRLFIEGFRHWSGVTPSEWRKKTQANPVEAKPDAR